MKAAIIGTGNIGTDLMVKMLGQSGDLKLSAMVGIDSKSDGIRRARDAGIVTTSDGLDGLRALPEYAEIDIVFDATSASAHARHAKILQADGKRVVDLTPAAVGPYVIPVVNLGEYIDAPNVNMVTCGGQATVPIVSAICAATERLIYGEIVASIASKSAGPGTRANIDEFTETTSAAICEVGGAEQGKAIIILNPAEPPLMMRDTVITLSQGGNEGAIRASVEGMVRKVADYVPGYALAQDVQFETIPENRPINVPGVGLSHGLKTTVLLRVEGAGDHLPAYAGNLDIMTSAALAVGTHLASVKRLSEVAP